MRGRSWSLVVSETREKIKEPTPVSKIRRIIPVNSPQFKRLVKEGVLMFVGKKPNNNGPDYKLYDATRNSQQLRIKGVE